MRLTEQIRRLTEETLELMIEIAVAGNWGIAKSLADRDNFGRIANLERWLEQRARSLRELDNVRFELQNDKLIVYANIDTYEDNPRRSGEEKALYAAEHTLLGRDGFGGFLGDAADESLALHELLYASHPADPQHNAVKPRVSMHILN